MVKILSGGQTGVDRAALDAAIAWAIPCGGWCPKGGLAEDMPHPPGLLRPYPMLQETPLADPAQRTEWNVRDSDRLMVLLDDRGLTSRGTEHAIRQARALGREVVILDLGQSADVDRAAAWLSARARGLSASPARAKARLPASIRRREPFSTRPSREPSLRPLREGPRRQGSRRAPCRIPRRR